MIKTSRAVLVVVIAGIAAACGGDRTAPSPTATATQTPETVAVLKNSGDIPGVPYVEVGKTYRILVGMGAMNFQVISIQKDGLATVIAAERGDFIGIRQGTIWWINLKNVLLLERPVQQQQQQ